MTDLPPSWAVARLADVADIRLGRQRSPKTHAGENMRPYLRAANVTWAGLDLSDVKEMHFSATEVDTYRLLPGDVLVAEASGSRGEVGKPALWNGEIQECCFQNTLLRVRSRGPEPRYLMHFLRHEALTGRLGDAARGVGIHHLGASGLSEYLVAIPPSREQSRIVAAIERHLSRIDAGVEPFERILRKVEVLRSASFSSCDLEAWPRKRWVDVGSSQNGRGFPSKDYCGEGVRLLRPGNLHASGRVEWTTKNTRCLPLRYRQEFRDYLVGSDEVVINLTAQSLKDEFLGRVCLTGSGDECLLNQRIARLKPRSEIDPRFLLYTLKSRRFRRFVASLNTGSLIQHMFTRQIDEYEVPVPPLDEQHEAVRRVDEQLSLLDATVQAVARSHVRAKRLRRTILDRAFSGQLLRQDPNDEPASELVARIVAERPTTSKPRRRQHA